MTGSTVDRHRAHIADLRGALAAGSGLLPADLVTETEQMLGALEQRLELGVDFTVVALAGGTGSGKSSTFNALSRLEFADVGVKRPTTARINACSWSADPSELLDWLGIDQDRRITRNTALDGDEERELDGLILLDLPDHDSIAEHHKFIVDAILPLVDLLIWIVDPQKYADQALHAGYLRELVDAQSSMVVAVNQIDTVSQSARELLLVDVERMLADDGLDRIAVRAVSARTGEGIDELRAALRGAVARKSLASVRMRNELSSLADRLRDQVPAAVMTDPSALLAGEVDKVLVTTGLSAVCDEVKAVHEQGLWNRPVPSITVPGIGQIAPLREQWVTKVGAGMTAPWADAVQAAVPSARHVTEELARALGAITIAWQENAKVTRMHTAALALFGLSAVGAILTLLGLTKILAAPATLIGVALFVLAGAGAVICRRVGQSWAKRWAHGRARDVRLRAREAAQAVLDAEFIQSVLPVLDCHEQVRSLTTRVIRVRN